MYVSYLGIFCIEKKRNVHVSIYPIGGEDEGWFIHGLDLNRNLDCRNVLHTYPSSMLLCKYFVPKFIVNNFIQKVEEIKILKYSLQPNVITQLHLTTKTNFVNYPDGWIPSTIRVGSFITSSLFRDAYCPVVMERHVLKLNNFA